MSNEKDPVLGFAEVGVFGTRLKLMAEVKRPLSL